MKDILPELNQKDYIKKLEQDYDIRFCKIDEVDELIDFIDKYWKKNHIFVLNRKLFDWQHLDRKNKRYNFIIAKHKELMEIHSILGFIPSNHFDVTIKNIQVWPCIWMAREDIHIKGLGVALYYYLKTNINIETISILGISEIALQIYQHWNFEVGKVEQYYMLNSNCKEYFLIKNYPEVLKKGKNEINESDKKLFPCSKSEFEEISDSLLKKSSRYKSKTYFIKRFFEHPVYKYIAYKIVLKSKIEGIIFFRICEALKKRALRIVDYVGNINSIDGCIKEFEKIMQEYDVEYIDFMVSGVQENYLSAAGFINRRDSSIIIPNYFEPFCLENIELDYAFKTISEDIEPIFYKADADQDRPNMLM